MCFIQTTEQKLQFSEYIQSFGTFGLYFQPGNMEEKKGREKDNQKIYIFKHHTFFQNMF